MHLRATQTEPDLVLMTLRRCEAAAGAGDLCGSTEWCRAALQVEDPDFEWLPILFFAETEVVGAALLQRQRAGWRSGSPGQHSIGWGMQEFGYHFAPRFLPGIDARDWWRALTVLFARDHLELRSTAPNWAPLLTHRGTEASPGSATLRVTAAEGLDAWLASLRGEHRRDLNYYRRRIDRSGGVWTDLAPNADLTESLAACFSMHALRIEEKGQESAYLMPRGRAFLSHLATTARDQLRISLLRVDGQVVGTNLSFLRNGHFQCFMPGWSPVHRKLDLGRQLIYHQILNGFEEGLRHIDLLGGDLPYKREFGLAPVPTTDIVRRPSRAAVLRARMVQRALRTYRRTRR